MRISEEMSKGARFLTQLPVGKLKRMWERESRAKADHVRTCIKHKKSKETSAFAAELVVQHTTA